MEQVKELKTKFKEGSLTRMGLIRKLRKVRMSAIGADDTKLKEFFDAPVEVIADRIIAESKS